MMNNHLITFLMNYDDQTGLDSAQTNYTELTHIFSLYSDPSSGYVRQDYKKLNSI